LATIKITTFVMERFRGRSVSHPSGVENAEKLESGAVC